jgi:Uma2 family endonuclease
MKITLHVQPFLDLSDDNLLLALSSMNPNLQIEVNRFQKLTITMPTKHRTGNSNIKLATRLQVWNEEHELGEAFDSSTGFRMPKTKSLFSPDFSWIENSRLEKIWESEGFLHIAPDFVAELRSDTDTLKELMEKMEEYIENGVRLGWLIDAKNEKVYIYRLENGNSEQDFDKNLSGETVLPKFELNLRKIFKKK